MKSRKTLILGIIVTLYARDAAADDAPVPTASVTHLKSESHVKTVKGSELDLPPGYFLTEAKYSALDLEMKRLQEQETRLTAENVSFRKSADEFSFGWITLSTIAVTAFGLGYALGR